MKPIGGGLTVLSFSMTTDRPLIKTRVASKCRRQSVIQMPVVSRHCYLRIATANTPLVSLGRPGYWSSSGSRQHLSSERLLTQPVSTGRLADPVDNPARLIRAESHNAEPALDCRLRSACDKHWSHLGSPSPSPRPRPQPRSHLDSTCSTRRPALPMSCQI